MEEHSFLWEGEVEKKPQFFPRKDPSAQHETAHSH